MWVVWGNDRYVDGWILKLFYPKYHRSTDRPSHESVRKILASFKIGEALVHVQRRILVTLGLARQGLVCFLEPRDFDNPGREDLTGNEGWFRISGTRRARAMSEGGAGTRTRQIKC